MSWRNNRTYNFSDGGIKDYSATPLNAATTYDLSKLHLFPVIHSFWFLEIIALGKVCVCGTVLLTGTPIDLTNAIIPYLCVPKTV